MIEFFAEEARCWNDNKAVTVIFVGWGIEGCERFYFSGELINISARVQDRFNNECGFNNGNAHTDSKGQQCKDNYIPKYQHLKYKNTLEIRSPEADEPSPLWEDNRPSPTSLISQVGWRPPGSGWCLAVSVGRRWPGACWSLGQGLDGKGQVRY